MNFQAFLFDGLTRWNAARAAAAMASNPSHHLRSFDVRIKDKVHLLFTDVLGEPLDVGYSPPSAYTNERFGVKYLYSEGGAGGPVAPTWRSIEEEADDGVTDIVEDDFPAPVEAPQSSISVAKPSSSMKRRATTKEKKKE